MRPKPSPSLGGRGFAIAATKCSPFEFIALRTFGVQDEEQQEEVENYQQDRKSVHAGVNAGGAIHVPLPQRRHRAPLQNPFAVIAAEVTEFRASWD